MKKSKFFSLLMAMVMLMGTLSFTTAVAMGGEFTIHDTELTDLSTLDDDVVVTVAYENTMAEDLEIWGIAGLYDGNNHLLDILTDQKQIAATSGANSFEFNFGELADLRGVNQDSYNYIKVFVWGTGDDNVYGAMEPIVPHERIEIPYLIDSEGELRRIGADSVWTRDRYYKLTNHISITESWNPIGAFYGVFDGNGKTISNMTISGESHQSMFQIIRGTVKNLALKDISAIGTDNYVAALAGVVDVGGLVQNITLTNVTVSSPTGTAVGAVAGRNLGTVENITASNVEVYGSESVGGLVGQSYGDADNYSVLRNITLTNIFVTGLRSIGGIAGVIGNEFGLASIVQNCTVQGDVTSIAVSGNAELGGIAGRSLGNAVIKDCAFAGNIFFIDNEGKLISDSSAVRIGGILGRSNSANSSSHRTDIFNCVVSGTISGGNNPGGVVGGRQAGYVVNINNCVVLLEEIVSNNDSGGRVIDATSSTHNNNYAFSNMDTSFVVSSAAKGSKDGESVIGESYKIKDWWTTEVNWTDTINPTNPYDVVRWDFTNVWGWDDEHVPYLRNANKTVWPDEDASDLGPKGDGTLQNPWQVRDETELRMVGKGIGEYTGWTLSENYMLMSDIELGADNSTNNWEPIGSTASPFTGQFNGNGHTITNLTIHTNTGVKGMFGEVNGGVVENLTLQTPSVTTTNNTAHDFGALAGILSGTAKVENIIVIGGTEPGSSFIASSSVNATRIGGLVGQMYDNSKVMSCAVIGKVKGARADNYSRVGGIVGVMSTDSEVQNCFFSGSVESGHADVGGIAGMASGSVANCIALGNVIGSSGYTDRGVGGLIGSGGAITNNVSLVSSIVSSGSQVSVTTGRIGGINATYTNNYAWSGGLVNGDVTTGSLNEKNGADAGQDTENDYRLLGWWTNEGNWNLSNPDHSWNFDTDTGVWVWNSWEYVPYLKITEGLDTNPFATIEWPYTGEKPLEPEESDEDDEQPPIPDLDLSDVCDIDNDTMTISNLKFSHVSSSVFLSVLENSVSEGSKVDILKSDGVNFVRGNVSVGDKVRISSKGGRSVKTYTIMGIMSPERNVTPSDVNIALNKSPMDTGFVTDYTAANFLDGNSDTFWRPEGSAVPFYFYVDLGEQHTFNVIRIVNAGGTVNVEAASRARGVEFAYSNDTGNSKTWSVVTSASVSDGPDVVGVFGPRGGSQDFVFTPISARYVRMSVTKSWHSDPSYVNRAAITLADLQIYNTSLPFVSSNEYAIVGAPGLGIIEDIPTGTTVGQLKSNITTGLDLNNLNVKRDGVVLADTAILQDEDVLWISDAVGYTIMVGLDQKPVSPDWVKISGSAFVGDTLTAQAYDGDAPIVSNIRYDWWTADRLEGPYVPIAIDSSTFYVTEEEDEKFIKATATRLGMPDATTVYYSDITESIAVKVGDLTAMSIVTASSSVAGYEPEYVLAMGEEYWMPTPSDTNKRLSMDFGDPITYSRIVLDFFNPQEIDEYVLSKSKDGKQWEDIAYTCVAGIGEALMTAPITAQYVRISIKADNKNVGIKNISLTDTLHTAENWVEAQQKTEDILADVEGYTESRWTKTKMTVPTIGYNSTITWSSSNPLISIDKGFITINRPTNDTLANIVIVYTDGKETKSITRTINLVGTGAGGSKSKGDSLGSGSGNSGRFVPLTQNTLAPSAEEVAPQTRLKDVSNSWAKDFVEALYNAGIISGTPEGNFEPSRDIKREEFVKLLVDAFGLLDTRAVTNLHDTSDRQWHYPYIASAQKHNIVQGLGDGTFGVGQTITRQDMAVMAYRAATVMGLQLNMNNEHFIFEDEALISDYAREAIQKMQMTGIISGMDDRTFRPHDNTTREQCAKIIFILWDMKMNTPLE